jgi:hypothetical protein
MSEQLINGVKLTVKELLERSTLLVMSIPMKLTNIVIVDVQMIPKLIVCIV